MFVAEADLSILLVCQIWLADGVALFYLCGDPPGSAARILDAAATLFAQHGYSGTKVGMVTGGAMVVLAIVLAIIGV